VPSDADDHVESFGQQHVDHRRGGFGVISEVAVSHDVDVGIDVGEHAPNDMALALLALAADDGSGLRCDLPRPVAAVVVVDVDGGRRQSGAKTAHGRADRRFLVVARQEHGDARWRLTVQLVPLG